MKKYFLKGCVFGSLGHNQRGLHGTNVGSWSVRRPQKQVREKDRQTDRQRERMRERERERGEQGREGERERG